MLAVDEALLTELPTVRFTATWVPSIGLTIAACESACCATATWLAAASTACWYEARSAADGDDDRELDEAAPVEPLLLPPLPWEAPPPDPLVAAARSRSASSAFDASTSACCAFATAVSALNTFRIAVWHALRLPFDGVVVLVGVLLVVVLVGVVVVLGGGFDTPLHTFWAEVSAAVAAASAVSTRCWAASTACCAAAMVGSLDVAAAISTACAVDPERAALVWADATDPPALPVLPETL